MEEQKLRNGRKFRLTILLSVLCLLGFFVTVTHTELSKNYEELCDTLVTILLVYCGGNVGNKWLSAAPPPETPKPKGASRKKTT
tara:strand:+ start:78 stop:329 length:252 start_codon:yes stop_codon:yes gene_type:complete